MSVRSSNKKTAEAHEDSLGRLLLRAHRFYAERALARLHARGHADLGVAHVTLLPHIDPQGTRVTVLATRAGMTKQAAGQLVAELERGGYVERLADEADRRAALVTFTRRGRQLLADASAVKADVDAEMTQAIGARGLHELERLLTALLASDGSRSQRSRD